MKNLLIATTVAIALTASNVYGQNYINELATNSCECINRIDEKTSGARAQFELRQCLIASARPFSSELLRDHKIDLSRDQTRAGEKLGAIVGVVMVDICPSKLISVAGRMSEEPADTRTAATTYIHMEEVEEDAYASLAPAMSQTPATQQSNIASKGLTSSTDNPLAALKPASTYKPVPSKPTPTALLPPPPPARPTVIPATPKPSLYSQTEVKTETTPASAKTETIAQPIAAAKTSTSGITERPFTEQKQAPKPVAKPTPAAAPKSEVVIAATATPKPTQVTKAVPAAPAIDATLATNATAPKPSLFASSAPKSAAIEETSGSVSMTNYEVKVAVTPPAKTTSFAKSGPFPGGVFNAPATSPTVETTAVAKTEVQTPKSEVSQNMAAAAVVNTVAQQAVAISNPVIEIAAKQAVVVAAPIVDPIAQPAAVIATPAVEAVIQPAIAVAAPVIETVAQPAIAVATSLVTTESEKTVAPVYESLTMSTEQQVVTGYITNITTGQFMYVYIVGEKGFVEPYYVIDPISSNFVLPDYEALLHKRVLGTFVKRRVFDPNSKTFVVIKVLQLLNRLE
jgi:hypothetical protein